MSMPIPPNRSGRFSILLFAVLTVYWIFTGKANMFFLIYIFWWDEFLKTVSALVFRFYRKNQIENLNNFRASLVSRFFMLFIYLIFIVVVFGIIISFSSDDKESIFTTFQILIFHNLAFNLSLLFIILREISVHLLTDKSERITEKNLSFGALMVLHVSIILGVFLWSFASGRMGGFDFDFGKNAEKFIILPFIIIKLIFDLRNLKSERQSV